jgi:integrase
MAAPMVKTRYPGIYSRGSRYVVKWTDRGVQRKEAFATLAQAREAQGKRRTGQTQAESNARFDEYAPAWLASYQGRTVGGLADSTRTDYTRAINKRAIPFFGATRMKQLRPADIGKFVQHLRDAGAKPPTIRKTVAALKVLLATAYENGDIAANPAQGLRLNLTRSTGKVKVMTDDEAALVIAAAPAEYQPLLTFLLQTGLRISEALGLTWAHVELGTKPHVKVRQQRYKGKVKALKTPTAVRDVPLAPSMVATLLELRTTRYSGPDGPVWCSVLGKGARRGHAPLEDHNLRNRVLRPAVKALGMPWVGFHTFRHTCASTLFARGKSIKQVQHWLGHADPSFTLRTYVHLQDGDLGGAEFWDADPAAREHSATRVVTRDGY